MYSKHSIKSVLFSVVILIGVLCFTNPSHAQYISSPYGPYGGFYGTNQYGGFGGMSGCMAEPMAPAPTVDFMAPINTAALAVCLECMVLECPLDKIIHIAA